MSRDKENVCLNDDGKSYQHHRQLQQQPPCPYDCAIWAANERASHRFEDIEVDPGPDVFLYLTTDASDPDDVDADGTLRVELDESVEGTFSFTGTFTNTVPDDFVAPDEVSSDGCGRSISSSSQPAAVAAAASTVFFFRTVNTHHTAVVTETAMYSFLYR